MASGFPVTINGITYTSAMFSSYGYVTNFPAILNDLAAVAAGIAAVAGSGGVVPNGQLAFPATQNPSANVNTLDDYEEGTWTPDLQFGGANTGITYTSRTGTYQKVGNRVTLKGDFVLSNKGSATGAAKIAGMPFVAASDGSGTTVVSTTSTYVTGVTATGMVIVIAFTANSTLLIYVNNNGASAALSDTAFSNTSSMSFNLTYQTTN